MMPAIQQYQPGDPIWWHDQPHRGYGAFHPVKASFVKYNDKTVTIAAHLANGGTREKTVPLSSIEPRT